MLNACRLDRATPLDFGSGRAAGLAADVTALAGKGAAVIVVADGALLDLEPTRAALAGLEAAGHRVRIYGEIRTDPKAAQIDAAASISRDVGATVVVGLGGGSAIDAAKLAAAVAAGGESADAYALCAIPLPAGTLPVIAIPTTAGTGAEVTRTAVFTHSDGRKVWAWGEALRPRLALLDPELSVSLPRHLTAWTGLDVLVHAIEAATNRRANPLNSASALQAIRLVTAYLPRAVSTPEDREARGGMLMAAALAGLAIDGSGTGIAHAIGHAIGTLAPVHHGRAVALSLGVTLALNQASAAVAHAEVAAAMGITSDRLEETYDRLLDKVSVDRDLAKSGLGIERASELLEVSWAVENQPMREANSHAFTREELGQAIARLLGPEAAV